jgi:hypothetical protein
VSLLPIEMEVDMEDQNVHVDNEQEVISDADLARKLLKKEQRLLTRLKEAQEAEARVLERFLRIQARLQRRSARLERIKSNLLLVRKQIADLQIAEQQDGHVEPALTILTKSEPSPQSDSDGTAHVQSDPELVAISDSSLAESGEIEPELVAMPDARIIALPGMAEAELVTNLEPTSVVPEETEPELVATPDATIIVLPGMAETDLVPILEPASVFDSATTELVALSTFEPEVDATPAAETSSQLEPTKPLPVEQVTQPIGVPLPQDVSLAKEAWVAAESAMQNARNTAHGLAASISLLSQSGGLSNELMAELLRKQSDANKALLKAQNAAREAYERYVQAQEEAERAASQSVDVSLGTSGDHNHIQQNQENGASPAEVDNAADQTAEMHAIRLYKEW